MFPVDPCIERFQRQHDSCHHAVFMPFSLVTFIGRYQRIHFIEGDTLQNNLYWLIYYLHVVQLSDICQLIHKLVELSN